MEQTPSRNIEDPAKEEIFWNIERIFDVGENKEGRREKIINFVFKIRPLLELIPEIWEDLVRSLLADCPGIEEREVFIEKAMSILEPLFKFKESKPLEYEEARRKIFLEDARAIRLNDILAYSIEGEEVSLHLPPAWEFIKEEGILAFRKKIREALSLLADIVSKNKDISGVVGISWIVASHPKLLESLGFTVEHGQLTDGDGPEGKRPISSAYMNRKDFLNKYQIK